MQIIKIQLCRIGWITGPFSRALLPLTANEIEKKEQKTHNKMVLVNWNKFDNVAAIK